MSRLARVSTADVRAFLMGTDVFLVDTRPVDQYNGWLAQGQIRNGHIFSAKSLPLKWCRYLDWLDVVRFKKIAASKPVILYGQNRDEVGEVAEHLIRAGYGDVRVYYDFLEEWAGSSKAPMSKLARFRHLVSAQWVHQLLSGKPVPEYNEQKFVICHAHYQNHQVYDNGHIPGAVQIDTNTLEDPETWNRRSPSELKIAFEKAGITSDTMVILYGTCLSADPDDPFPGSSAGHIAAMRCAFIMLYAGVKDVRILNGGFQAWKDEGFEISREESVPEPVQDFGADIPAKPEFAVDVPEAKQILADSDKNLVCVRSWREYVGEVSGYNYIRQKGRIPGAVFADCGTDAYHMENYRNVDHTTREYHEIEQLWAKSGITPDKHNAFYCGTGWRGSEAFINAWLMEWPRISVFDGGWYEWSSDGNNPVETGVPTKT